MRPAGELAVLGEAQGYALRNQLPPHSVRYTDEYRHQWSREQPPGVFLIEVGLQMQDALTDR